MAFAEATVTRSKLARISGTNLGASTTMRASEDERETPHPLAAAKQKGIKE
jgi:hypothetical protein